MPEDPVSHSINVHGMSYFLGRYHPQEVPASILTIWEHEKAKHYPQLIDEIYAAKQETDLDTAISGAAIGLALHVIGIHEIAHTSQILQSFQHSHN